MARRKSSRLMPTTPKESLNEALGAIRVTTGIIEDELRPHLETVLMIVQDRKRGAAEQVVVSGILPILAQAMRRRGPLTSLTARLVSELARETVVRERCSEAGLVSALLSVLAYGDKELLLHAGRAIGRICYDSHSQQEQFLRQGVVPRLIGILLRYPDDEALEGVFLLALCNLGDMGEGEEAGQVWEKGVPLRPEEIVYRGISRHSCGISSVITVVRLSQWAPGQNAVSIEVFHRCSTAFWSIHGNKRRVRRFPLSHLGTCPKFYKVIKYSVQNIPNSRSIKTRVFQTFL